MAKFSDLEKKVIDWADDKGIFEKGTPLAQARKTEEEVHELIEACVAQHAGFKEFVNIKGKICKVDEELKDAFGDILVTIIIGAEMQGLSLEDCLESAYKVISQRKGKMVDGQFVKDEK